MNPKIILLSQLLGILMFLVPLFKIMRWKIENHYLRFIFILFLSWSMLVIARGFHFDRSTLQYLIQNPNYGMFFYFIPLIILVPWNADFGRKMFLACFISGLLFLILVFYFRGNSFNRSHDFVDAAELPVRMLAIPCGFLLLTFKYHKGYVRLLSALIVIFALLFAIYKGRRGLTTATFSVLFAAYVILVFFSNFKGAVIYFSILFFVLGTYYVSSIYDINSNNLLNLMVERGTEDTRTGVELYFYNDMNLKDWIIGRGLDGKYFCPDIDEGSLTDYRSVIETGYLQIILKGGIIRLGLFLLMAIPGFILGVFKSRNILSKAAAAWILIVLIALYPDTVESFSMFYLLLWIAIGICFSAKIRNMSDAELIASFNADPLARRNKVNGMSDGIVGTRNN